MSNLNIPADFIEPTDPDGGFAIVSMFTSHYSTVDHDSYVRYEPWIGSNREVGLRCTRHDGAVQFIYFNPSSDSDGSVDPDVFVYLSPVFPAGSAETRTGDPAFDTPQHFYNVLQEES